MSSTHFTCQGKWASSTEFDTCSQAQTASSISLNIKAVSQGTHSRVCRNSFSSRGFMSQYEISNIMACSPAVCINRVSQYCKWFCKIEVFHTAVAITIICSPSFPVVWAVCLLSSCSANKPYTHNMHKSSFSFDKSLAYVEVTAGLTEKLLRLSHL